MNNEHNNGFNKKNTLQTTQLLVKCVFVNKKTPLNRKATKNGF